MIRVFLNENSQVTHTIHGDIWQIELNTPKDAKYVDVDAFDFPIMRSIWAEDKGQFLDMGEPPQFKSVYDFNARKWIDARSLYDVKITKWEELKTQRNKLEFGGFEYKGNIYDSDQVSQGRIMGAAVAGVDQVWTLANNTTVNLTGDELKELYAALQAHVAAVHERGRLARFNIDVAMTPQEVEAVTL